MNHSLAKGRTQAKREITSIYNIPSSLAMESMRVKNANSTTLTGSIDASSRYTPLRHFKPKATSGNVTTRTTRTGALYSRKTKRRSKNQGVQVEIIKGQRKIISSAFFMPGSFNATVVARGQYSQQRRFEFRTKRVTKTGNDLPIDSLRTVSVFKSAINTTVQKRLADYVMGEYGKRITHEIERGLQYGTR